MQHPAHTAPALPARPPISCHHHLLLAAEPALPGLAWLVPRRNVSHTLAGAVKAAAYVVGRLRCCNPVASAELLVGSAAAPDAADAPACQHGDATGCCSPAAAPLSEPAATACCCSGAVAAVDADAAVAGSSDSRISTPLLKKRGGDACSDDAGRPQQLLAPLLHVAGADGADIGAGHAAAACWSCCRARSPQPAPCCVFRVAAAGGAARVAGGWWPV